MCTAPAGQASGGGERLSMSLGPAAARRDDADVLESVGLAKLQRASVDLVRALLRVPGAWALLVCGVAACATRWQVCSAPPTRCRLTRRCCDTDRRGRRAGGGRGAQRRPGASVRCAAGPAAVQHGRGRQCRRARLRWAGVAMRRPRWRHVVGGLAPRGTRAAAGDDGRPVPATVAPPHMPPGAGVWHVRAVVCRWKQQVGSRFPAATCAPSRRVAAHVLTGVCRPRRLAMCRAVTSVAPPPPCAFYSACLTASRWLWST